MGFRLTGRFWHSASFAFTRYGLWTFRPPTFIVLLGGPGAGKGTLAKELVPLIGLPHISTGDLFRKEVASGSALGRAVDPILRSGGLVPDEITIAVLAEELSKFRNRHGAIIDGFPRTLPQALLLDNLFAGWGQELDFSLFLDGSNKDFEVRLSGRRTCSNKECGRTYHVEFKRPRVEGVCDTCKSPLIRRDDDAPEVVGPRLEKFRANNQPIVDHHERRQCLHRIKTTNQDPEGHVLQQVLHILSKRGVRVKRAA
ncbi:MAG: nucleoside monophosphate kinase [Candidatus Melainabacteria bacterium]|nr:nucleoside monophosphate kinase [Candidatus Melainabacteria bacterium]